MSTDKKPVDSGWDSIVKQGNEIGVLMNSVIDELQPNSEAQQQMMAMRGKMQNMMKELSAFVQAHPEYGQGAMDWLINRSLDIAPKNNDDRTM